jgi:hypothetical protein
MEYGSGNTACDEVSRIEVGYRTSKKIYHGKARIFTEVKTLKPKLRAFP